MSIYTVRRVNKEVNLISHLVSYPSIAWHLAEEGHIGQLNWDAYSDEVESRFYVLYNDYNLYVLLLTQGLHETKPRANVRAFQGPVHLDSCLEFFLSYDPNHKRYMNIETNALATKYIAVGDGRKNRYNPNAEEASSIIIESVRFGDPALKRLKFDYDWGVFIHLPIRFLASYWPEILDDEGNLNALKPGQKIKGNFYKCGDDTEVPHFFSWSPIETEKPDFHRPEFFGQLIME